MKRFLIMLSAVIIIFTVAGCERNQSSENKIISGTSSQAASQESSDTASSSSSGNTKVDYDLTAMGSDMVYATVYQMMIDPDAYTGKTIRMKGIYYSSYYEPTQQYYHYCIIQDATACCAQGLEFVWGSGEHFYPTEYPAENAEIIVEGTFDVYQKDNTENRYCRLLNSTLEVV